MGRQFRLELDEKKYFIDLLFYHRKLKLMVAIELKTTEFKPEHSQQLNWYFHHHYAITLGMKIRFEDLKNKINDLTALMLTHPVKRDDRATEIWIKFRNDGVYLYINFEYPIPEPMVFNKLVGAGNALDCSDYKKDEELTQYGTRGEVLGMLEKSIGFRGNLDQTVHKVIELINSYNSSFIRSV